MVATETDSNETQVHDSSRLKHQLSKINVQIKKNTADKEKQQSKTSIKKHITDLHTESIYHCNHPCRKQSTVRQNLHRTTRKRSKRHNHSPIRDPTTTTIIII